MDLNSIFRGIIGILVLIGFAYLLSNNKKKVNWKLVISGLGLQFVFAVFILRGNDLRSFFLPLGWPIDFFNWISGFFVILLNFTTAGAVFIFGDLALPPGADGSLGSFFAFQVLPTIIFFACLMSVLYYVGFMQLIVRGMAWVMARIDHCAKLLSFRSSGYQSVV